jgi:hypothetical protein
MLGSTTVRPPSNTAESNSTASKHDFITITFTDFINLRRAKLFAQNSLLRETLKCHRGIRWRRRNLYPMNAGQRHNADRDRIRTQQQHDKQTLAIRSLPGTTLTDAENEH